MSGSTIPDRSAVVDSLARRVLSLPPGRWLETRQAMVQLVAAAGSKSKANAAIDRARKAGAKIHQTDLNYQTVHSHSEKRA